MTTISEALAISLDHQKAGRLLAAEQGYRQILAVEPEEADALNLLGVVVSELGRCDEAQLCLLQAIRLEPDRATFHNNLGNVLKKQGLLDEAVASYRHALAVNPQHIMAHYNLAIALQEQGQTQEAVHYCRQVLNLMPDHAEPHLHLGDALRSDGRIDEAIESYRRAVQLAPQCIEAHHCLGGALREAGRAADAANCFREVVRQRPSLMEAHCNLALALTDSGQLDEAVVASRRALQIAPRDARAHNNLGHALLAWGDLDEAEALLRTALQLDANNTAALCNLSVALKDQGRVAESIACCRTAMDIDPNLEQAHGNLLYAMYFSADCDARAICAEHRRWNEKFAARLIESIAPHANDRSPERRLRVGYVSPDFRLHPVGRFIAPVVENHDRNHFDVVLYASVRRPDLVTEHFRSACDAWHDALPLSDQKLAEAIRRDRIDILVDLTMHMSGSRLPAFARRPAPVQVTYLAYCGTTGLTAIDYRLTDPHLDPRDQDPAIYTEESIHLPETYWCYRPAVDAPPPDPPPLLRAGHVTFGCLNNFCKVSPGALEAWSQIMQATPGSRLLLHARPGGHRGRVVDFFQRRGVAENRIEFVGFLPIDEFYRAHQRIDVALDPFPYGGGTTTCDALWMGVPVVSLVGELAVGRAGLSILSNVGLPELAAKNVEAYIETSVALAGDPRRLGEFRDTLRERMKRSPLMDCERFTRNVENCYRRMWQAWCSR